MAVRLDEVCDPALLLRAGLQQAPRQLPRPLPLPRPALRLPPRPRRLARLVPGAVVLSTAQHSASEFRRTHISAVAFNNFAILDHCVVGQNWTRYATALGN